MRRHNDNAGHVGFAVRPLFSKENGVGHALPHELAVVAGAQLHRLRVRGRVQTPQRRHLRLITGGYRVGIAGTVGRKVDAVIPAFARKQDGFAAFQIRGVQVPLVRPGVRLAAAGGEVQLFPFGVQVQQLADRKLTLRQLAALAVGFGVVLIDVHESVALAQPEQAVQLFRQQKAGGKVLAVVGARPRRTLEVKEQKGIRFFGEQQACIARRRVDQVNFHFFVVTALAPAGGQPAFDRPADMPAVGTETGCRGAGTAPDAPHRSRRRR